MKKLTGIFLALATFILVSCEGDMGPMGPPGEDGEDFIGSVFEVEGDFTPDNNYSFLVDYPSNITVYDGDVVLVYILWEVDNGTDIWRLCPQTVVLGEGVIQYNFDYTLADVRIFLEFTIPEEDLLPAETQNQIFRVAILPADFANSKSVDVTDFNSILQAPNLELKSFDKLDLSKQIEMK